VKRSRANRFFTERRWLIAVGATVSLLLPPQASAQPASSQPASPPPDQPAYAFDMPEGWGFQVRAGVQQIMTIGGDDAQHIIRLNVVPNRADPDAYAAELIANGRARGEEWTDDGSTTVCDGRPAHRWTTRSVIGAVTVVLHGLATNVTGGLGTAVYGHRGTVPDRPDAMAALTSLCPAPFAMPSIEGWTRVPTSPVGTVVLNSADKASSFYGSYRRLARERFPNVYRNEPGATVVRTTDTTCANGLLRRVDLRKGATVEEVAEGYLDSGYSYVFTYERPENRAAGPAAERALTAFCQATMPSPAPS
jgi:hypothetical protein